jgi:hypothetical protein
MLGLGGGLDLRIFLSKASAYDRCLGLGKKGGPRLSHKLMPEAWA